MIRVDSYRPSGVCLAAGAVTEWTGSPMMGEKPKRARRLSRAVDRFAEWLLPDPDAEAEHELQTMLDQGKQTRGKKPPKKG